MWPQAEESHHEVFQDETFHRLTMLYQSNFLSALFFSATLLQQRFAAAQFIGSIIPYGTLEGDGVLLVTIENNSTGNYSIGAWNNLFDDQNPYKPLIVRNLKGQIEPLVGTKYPYGELTDAAFINMSPGAIWQRKLNMTEYIVPDALVTAPYSECVSIAFPADLYALNTTDFVSNENLATGFLAGKGAVITVKATPLHLNITVAAGRQGATVAATATVGAQNPATLVQGTNAPGLGGWVPGAGTSIEPYLPNTGGIFAKAQPKPQPS